MENNAYENFKTNILIQLDGVPVDTLNKFSRILDVVANDYNITKKSNEIAVVGREYFTKLLAMYLIVRKTEGIKISTLNNQSLTIRKFIDYVNVPIDKIVANDIRSFLFNYQSERGVVNRTLEQMRIAICVFFKWCYSEGYIEKNPCENIKKIKYTSKPRKALTQKELELVRNACVNNRDIAITEFLYSTGCRVSEMCNVKISDIDWQNHELQVLGKGDKYRTVYINAKCEVALEKYLAARNYNSEFLFTNHHGGGKISKYSVEDIYRKIQKNTNIQITPHILRHTFATQALTGTGVEVVQKLLGHANIATTMVYAEVNQNSIKSAHSKCII